jgi:hypothetical protein
MKRLLLMLMIIVIFVSAGCGSHNTQGNSGESETDSLTGDSNSSAGASNDLGSQIPASPAENELKRIMEAGNLFVYELQNHKQPSNEGNHYYDYSYDAVAAFERFFLLDTLHVSGMFIDPYQGYVCQITGKNQYNNDRTTHIMFNPDDQMKWFCELVEYLEIGDIALETYIKYLREKDDDGLAYWLAIDSEPSVEMVQSAKNRIAYHNSFLDLSQTKVREYDISDGYYRYVVEDANGITFEVEMYYGDGFCQPFFDDWSMAGI